MKLTILIAGLLTAASVLTFLLLNADDARLVQSEISVAAVLSGDDSAGYKRAVEPAEFKFPSDHGPHAGFKTEWWYFTGNLQTAEGRRFGYQLTFFRTALSPHPPAGGSVWRTNEIFMGHFTVTDVADNEFYFSENFSRQAYNLASASADPFSLKLYNWSVSGRPDGIGQTGGYFNISADNNETGIGLELSNIKPLVLQGEKGFSRKGPEDGNASYYYSFTRLRTQGSVRVKGQTFSVEGFSWMDREWSTSSLNKEQAGWDWFSLQLSDNTELMYYRIRKKDGSEDKFTSCRIIRNDGSVKVILPEQVNLQVKDTFESSDDVRYPAGWQLTVKDENTDLFIKPLVKDQELKTSVRYWEGAVSVSGRSQGKTVEGSGYIELTGYSKPGAL